MEIRVSKGENECWEGKVAKVPDISELEYIIASVWHVVVWDSP
jgi:hypothetical protein